MSGPSAGDAASELPLDGTSSDAPPAVDAPGEDPLGEDRGATGALLGQVLRIGVTISGFLLIAGLFVEWRAGGLAGGDAAREAALSSTDHPTTPFAILRGLMDGDSDAFITLGLLTLLATPIVRIVVAMADFRRRGDRIFTVICASVLVLLAISFVIESVT